MVKIYFGSEPLIIINESEIYKSEFETTRRLINPSSEEVKNLIISLKEKPETIIIQTENIETTFKKIAELFTIIQAGGGLAYTPDEQVLLIFRKGKWDLPKGKLDPGETLERCAVREVEEETGLNGITLGKKITTTYHTYKEKGQHILKESHWYLMTVPHAIPLTPQTEEDIQECKWIQKTALESYIKAAHPSVADVLNDWLKNYF